jgi:hypothetical protein
MAVLTFSNVKYHIGGGKKPRRMRRNQNYTFVIFHSEKHLLEYSDETLIANLDKITDGRVYSSSTTKLKRKQ